MLLDPDCKKPKLSLRMLMKYWTPSSYRIGTKVSRKWDEGFSPCGGGSPEKLSLPQSDYLGRERWTPNPRGNVMGQFS
jgi:hypothetical protein